MHTLRYIAPLLSVLSLAACVSPSLPSLHETQSYAPITAHEQRRVPVFVSWYEHCDPRRCDTDGHRAQERLLTCINEGMHRTSVPLTAFSSGHITASQPSALTEDPRAKGHPDSRLGHAAREAALRAGVKYAVLIEATTLRDERTGTPQYQADGYSLLLGIWGGSQPFRVRTLFDAVILDVETQRWVARVRRGYAGNGESSAAYVLFIVPFAYGETSPKTETLACEAVGEAVGKLFRDGSWGE